MQGKKHLLGAILALIVLVAIGVGSFLIVATSHESNSTVTSTTLRVTTTLKTSSSSLTTMGSTLPTNCNAKNLKLSLANKAVATGFEKLDFEVSVLSPIQCLLGSYPVITLLSVSNSTFGNGSNVAKYPGSYLLTISKPAFFSIAFSDMGSKCFSSNYLLLNLPAPAFSLEMPLQVQVCSNLQIAGFSSIAP